MRLRPREIHFILLVNDLVLLNLCYQVCFLAEKTRSARAGSLRLLILLNVAYFLISPLFISNLRDLKVNVIKMVKILIRRFIYFFAVSSLLIMLLFPQGVPKTPLLFTFVLFFAVRLVASLVFFYFYFFNTHLYLRATVIIGNNQVGRRLQSYFRDHTYLGIRPIGILAETPDFEGEKNVIGSVLDFQTIFDKTPFEDALIVVPLTASDLIIRLIALSEKNGVRVHLVPNYAEMDDRRFSVTTLGEIPLVQMRKFPLGHYSNRFWKRIFDIFFSSLAILLLLPIGLIIGIAIKLTSKGPVFYKTKRVGVTGAVFTLYKFRTMNFEKIDDTDIKSTVLNDERITKLGKFLRAYSLDELPQFFNVFQNQMSIVGPRPHRINLNQDLRGKMNNYMIRHIVKPGITGWAQVNGWRGPTETKLQYWGRTFHDIWYIEHWNFWLDLYIIWLTVFGKKTRINAF